MFSTFANTQIKNQAKLDVMPPSGNFYTDLQSSNKKNYVAFAAGSGINTGFSIIKTTLITEPKAPLHWYLETKIIHQLFLKKS